MSGWKPIETAPRDGTPILAFTRFGDYQVLIWYSPSGRLDCPQHGWGYDPEDIVGWRALPKPPKAYRE